MATAYRGFQLGLLPERKINKRASATATAWWRWSLLIVINIGLMLPEKIQIVELPRDAK